MASREYDLDPEGESFRLVDIGDIPIDSVERFQYHHNVEAGQRGGPLVKDQAIVRDSALVIGSVVQEYIVVDGATIG